MFGAGYGFALLQRPKTETVFQQPDDLPVEEPGGYIASFSKSEKDLFTSKDKRNLQEQLDTLLDAGFSSGELQTDWLARTIFGEASYQHLTVGNPQVRDAWIVKKASELGKLLTDPLLIDVSAGNKPYEANFRDSGFRYYSSEFGSNTILTDYLRGEKHGEKKNKTSMLEKYNFVYSDINNTNIPAAMFDVAVLTEVLEHLPEPVVAIQELARIVKPGGHILVTAPFTSGSHQQPFHFSSGYPREWYRYAADKADLEIVEMTSQGGFFHLMAQEVNRAKKCGVPPRELRESFAPLVESMRHAFHYFLLLKGEQNDESVSCVDQFTIGWMVHLRKR